MIWKNKEQFQARTDLAVEINQQVNPNQGRLNGIDIYTQYAGKACNESAYDVKQITIEIKNEHGAHLLNRPMGTYITMEAGRMYALEEDLQDTIVVNLTKNIQKLLMGMVYDIKKCTILVVGLGNRTVTADALGPEVIRQLNVADYLQKDENAGRLYAICPGVKAQTGLETADIVSGIVKQAHPDVVIAVDALAARDVKRLNASIQLSDRGIHPGSGVGNHRMGLTRETIGVPVLAIGVPTVVDTTTIVYDALELLVENLCKDEELGIFTSMLQDYTPRERYRLYKEELPEELSALYVTPKEIDEQIAAMGKVISGAIQKLLD